jgi:hypothetical protein
MDERMSVAQMIVEYQRATTALSAILAEIDDCLASDRFTAAYQGILADRREAAFRRVIALRKAIHTAECQAMAA